MGQVRTLEKEGEKKGPREQGMRGCGMLKLAVRFASSG